LLFERRRVELEFLRNFRLFGALDRESVGLSEYFLETY
jgi:hypothetical protein